MTALSSKGFGCIGASFPPDLALSAACSAKALGFVLGELERLDDGVGGGQRLQSFAARHAGLAFSGKIGVWSAPLVIDAFVEHRFQSLFLFFVDEEGFIGALPHANRAIAAAVMTKFPRVLTARHHTGP